jgi:hypothetical protein
VESAGIKQKYSVRPMGFVPREMKRPQTIKMNFSWRFTKGGCNSPWRVQFLGMREREE